MRLAAAPACGANEGLEPREAELDGIEVRAIGWQAPECGPGGLDGALDAGDLVAPRLSSMTIKTCFVLARESLLERGTISICG